jgi:hypothetical protein
MSQSVFLLLSSHESGNNPVKDSESAATPSSKQCAVNLSVYATPMPCFLLMSETLSF